MSSPVPDEEQMPVVKPPAPLSLATGSVYHLVHSQEEDDDEYEDKCLKKQRTGEPESVLSPLQLQLPLPLSETEEAEAVAVAAPPPLLAVAEAVAEVEAEVEVEAEEAVAVAAPQRRRKSVTISNYEKKKWDGKNPCNFSYSEVISQYMWMSSLTYGNLIDLIKRQAEMFGLDYAFVFAEIHDLVKDLNERLNKALQFISYCNTYKQDIIFRKSPDSEKEKQEQPVLSEEETELIKEYTKAMNVLIVAGDSEFSTIPVTQLAIVEHILDDFNTAIEKGCNV